MSAAQCNSLKYKYVVLTSVFTCTYESVYLVLTEVSTPHSFLAVVIEECL